MQTKVILFAVIGMFLITPLALADVPHMINYQGALTDDNGVPLDTAIAMTFAIYESQGILIPLWEETQPCTVRNGLFSVLLGAIVPITPGVFNGDVRYLGITIGDDPEELQPRKEFVTVAYAYKANHAQEADSAFTAPPDDDWETSGNNIYRLTGNVGIGTDSPSYDLDVRWNARIQRDLIVEDDLTVQDDLTINGTLKLTFDYESPWTALDAGSSVTFTHNLGGYRDKYIVYLDGKGTYGIHHYNYGSSCWRDGLVNRWCGCEWGRLTTTSIRVDRAADDEDPSISTYKQWQQVRIRILKNQ